MTTTLELKVSDEQLDELKHRAGQRGLDSPAKLIAELAREELSETETAEEARREAVASNLERKGWDRQAERVRSGEIDPEPAFYE